MVAGAVAAVLSGAPSTAWTLARGGNLLDSTEAAGTIVLGESAPRVQLLAAGVLAHATISVGWGVVLAAVMPPRRSAAVAGGLAGLAIAGLDLGVIGRRFPRVRALDPVPQVLDHIAFGVVVAAVLRRRRASA